MSMLRRQARVRREYVYRKSIEARDRTAQDKKNKLKAAVAEGKTIPTELQEDAIELQEQADWDDSGADGVRSTEDDEYLWAGVEDPKILITTSRSPSSKLRQFAKELKLIYPNSQRINRGNYEMKQLVQACQSQDVTDLVIIHEHRGVPNALKICHFPYGPTAVFTLKNVVSRHDVPDIGKMSEAYPHLVFRGFSTRVGLRAMDILKYLFPPPKEDSRRVMSYSVRDDVISFRHHVYRQEGKNFELEEVGPRFEMKLYKIFRGTLDQEDRADVEFIQRPYMNTARKRRYLTKDEEEEEEEKTEDPAGQD